MNETVSIRRIPNWIFGVFAAAVLVALFFAVSAPNIDTYTPPAEQPAFTIQPKIGFDSTIRSLATSEVGVVEIEEGRSFVLDLGNSFVANPPARYYYDNDADGIAETPFTYGDWAVFTMYKSDPLPKVCKAVKNGEECQARIKGVDSAGNTAEYVLRSTTVYT